MGILLAEISLRLPRRSLGAAVAYRESLQRQHATLEDATISAADGVSLKAWFVQPAQPNGRSVVLVHGVTDNRIGVSGYSAMLLNQGYAVLLPDSRAHGESGGAIATYGVLEREDIHRWAQWLRTRASGCTYLLGESMGAAIGLQAEPVTPQLCAVAVESPYSTFRSISYERLGRDTRTGTLFWRTLGRPIIESAILYSRLRYGVWLTNASPEDAVLHAATPTLLIAGTDDVNIPMHHAQELKGLCSNHCALWIVPGAAHGEASLVAHDEFEQRVVGWFQNHDEAPAR